MSNAELASELFLTESTVKSHLSSAFAKLNVSSRHEAARLVLDPVRGPALGIRLESGEQPESTSPGPDPRAVPAA
ncbi:MAG: helix-turn-helix transcriptional regulator [Solirubrobacterales bacterium]